MIVMGKGIRGLERMIAAAMLAVCTAAVPSARAADITSADAASARHVAEADARAIISMIKTLSPLVTVAEYERAFGPGRQTYDLGGGEYRNMEWTFPMKSIDVDMVLHVSFNYGSAAEWAAVMDFGARSDDERKYFAALCNGSAVATGHTSRVARHEQEHAPSARFSRGGKIVSHRAHYPAHGEIWAEISSTDGPKGAEIMIRPASEADADDAALIVVADEASIREWPSASAPIKRVRLAGHMMTALEREVETVKGKKSTEQIVWIRVCDVDGSVGWVRSSDVKITGVSDVSSVSSVK